MSTVNYLFSIGVNTGNSLDAVDVVLTKFGTDGSIEDLEALSEPMPNALADQLRTLREASVECESKMELVETVLAQRSPQKISLAQLIRQYTLYAAEAAKALIKRAQDRGIVADVIGFHGQTCAHQPPSISKDPKAAYTLQVGDGQLLANETGIAVVYDFRSDDIMNGGEGAPIAPVHHQHLADYLRHKGKFPIAFCNAGNTGNISVISEEAGATKVLGWDVGPFNEFPDRLMRLQRGQNCDTDGVVGTRGQVNAQLLNLLFKHSAVTERGENFLIQPPPKSSDPQWYRLLPEQLGEAPVGDSILSFEDRLRTSEYFSAYVYFFSLKWLSPQIIIPRIYALCGGGWSNPVCRGHFEDLLNGRFDKAPVLSEHQDVFQQISSRLNTNQVHKLEVAFADEYGFSGQYMEARLFADAAVCRIMGRPFTFPATSGCTSPTVLGIIRFPQGKRELASARLNEWLAEYQSRQLTLDDPKAFDGRWSRAAHGWSSLSHPLLNR